MFVFQVYKVKAKGLRSLPVAITLETQNQGLYCMMSFNILLREY